MLFARPESASSWQPRGGHRSSAVWQKQRRSEGVIHPSLFLAGIFDGRGGVAQADLALLLASRLLGRVF